MTSVVGDLLREGHQPLSSNSLSGLILSANIFVMSLYIKLTQNIGLNSDTSEVVFVVGTRVRKVWFDTLRTSARACLEEMMQRIIAKGLQDISGKKQTQEWHNVHDARSCAHTLKV